jgi:hypothetical protein
MNGPASARHFERKGRMAIESVSPGTTIGTVRPVG